MHDSVLAWTSATLNAEHVEGKLVVEVGAYNVNGSVRPIVEAFHPMLYLGIDIEAGPGVDEVCELADAVDKFGQFDLVICTEVLEHVVDWRRSILDLVELTAPLGHLLITTRGPGFPYHPYPIDTWRYTVPAMTEIFNRLDLKICEVSADPQAPGVFVLAQKPEFWSGPWSPAILHDVDGVTPMVRS